MDKKENGARDQSVSRSAMIAMVAILVGLISVSVYANWQEAHRAQIESVKVTRFTPSPTPRPSPTQ